LGRLHPIGAGGFFRRAVGAAHWHLYRIPRRKSVVFLHMDSVDQIFKNILLVFIVHLVLPSADPQKKEKPGFNPFCTKFSCLQGVKLQTFY
jgi:hypothetical protein